LLFPYQVKQNQRRMDMGRQVLQIFNAQLAADTGAPSPKNEKNVTKIGKESQISIQQENFHRQKDSEISSIQSQNDAVDNQPSNQFHHHSENIIRSCLVIQSECNYQMSHICLR
jgi:hypothetical protein